MMFTCPPLCADPAHGHARLRRTARSATSKVVKNRRGKLTCVDLHCHYLNRDVAAKVAHLNPAQYEPSVQFASRAGVTDLALRHDRARARSRCGPRRRAR